MQLEHAFGTDLAAKVAARLGSAGQHDLLMETIYKVQARDRYNNLLWEDAAINRVVTVGLNIVLSSTFTAGVTSPTWYVGICGASVSDGAMTANAATLVCATSTPFVSADASRSIIVRGAGASGADLVTTIATYGSAGTVTLAATAGTTVSGAAVIWEARAGDTMSSHTPWSESTAYTNSTRPQWNGGTVSNGSVDNSASQASFNINTNNTLIGGLFLVNNSTVGGTSGTLYGMAPFTVSFRQLNNGDTLSVTASLTAAST
jgi:hypothetical protein